MADLISSRSCLFGVTMWYASSLLDIYKICTLILFGLQLLDIVRDPHSKTPSLIFEWVNNIDFRKLYPTFTDPDVRVSRFWIVYAQPACCIASLWPPSTCMHRRAVLHISASDCAGLLSLKRHLSPRCEGEISSSARIEVAIVGSLMTFLLLQPHNVMIDHQKKELRLIDWGLAEFYHPGWHWWCLPGTGLYVCVCWQQ